MQKQILYAFVSASILLGTGIGQTHPRFQFFKMKKGEGLVSLVVPARTTDKELTSLLRFIQSQVQSGKFSELGITQPTDKRYGKFGYGAGIISIYRGTKCANEQFIDDLGPCGYGEHEAASYKWGVHSDPRKDEALIRGQNGDLQKVF